jgi:broad specificity phosphatase PhoE
MSEITKQIYFVRHGETDANANWLIQPLEQPLNQLGFIQADKIAERSKNLTFTKLLSSDQLRTVQTATAISKANNIEIETSTLFRECTNPSHLIGLSYEDPQVKEYHQDLKDFRVDPNWRYGDEESFNDSLERAKKAIQYLESLEDSQIMVVSHGKFLRFILAYVVLGDSLTAEQFALFAHRVRMSNTGITIINNPAGYWQLLSWNDHAHFAE